MTVLRIAPLFAFIIVLVAACLSPGGGYYNHSPTYRSDSGYGYPGYTPYDYWRQPKHKKHDDNDNSAWGKPVRKLQKTLKKLFH